MKIKNLIKTMLPILVITLMMSFFSLIPVQNADAAQQQLLPPWEEAPDFQKAISMAGTPYRMSVFSATLKDPLPGELSNVEHAAELLAGTVVNPGEIFSQNYKLGPYTHGKGYQEGPTYSGNTVITTVGGGVCKIASVLYNLTRLANLPVVERYNHSLTVPYVPPGQDATVYYGSRDFKFMNNSAGPILIWAKTYDKTLIMAFYSRQIAPDVTWEHEVLKKLQTWTTYHYNPNLPAGTEEVVLEGQEGIIVKSRIKIHFFNGQTEIKNLGKNYYSPSPKVIERGTRRN